MKSQCMGCEQTFSGMTLFDAHRRGEYPNRRCITPEEMREIGWREVRGTWRGPAPTRPPDFIRVRR